MREAVFPQRTREFERDGIFALVSSDGVDTGVRDDPPRVPDAVLDLEESPLTVLTPRCARSLLISVVSADGNESGSTLVLTFAADDEVGMDARLDAVLLPDRQPYVVLRPPTCVFVTSAVSEEPESRALDFSRDRGLSRSLSRFTLCTLVNIFLGVTARDLDRGVVVPKLDTLEVMLVGFVRVLFCDSEPLEVFFLAALEAVAVLFTFARLVRTDTLPAMDELSLPPSLVPSPPVGPSRTSSGSVDPHGSSYTEQQLTRLESQEASSKPPQLLP